MLTLVGSWFTWYALLSIGWPHYFFPCVFLSTPFVAAIIYDATDQYSLPATFQRLGLAIKSLHPDGRSMGAFAILVIIVITVPLTISQLSRAYQVYVDDAALRVAQFLNNSTPPNALIETYDSELFFLIDRPYHYPPDEFNVDMIRRRDLGHDIPLTYNPLAADPDYLVMGAFSIASQLYDGVLAEGEFQLLQTYGHYCIYQRVR